MKETDKEILYKLLIGVNMIIISGMLMCIGSIGGKKEGILETKPKYAYIKKDLNSDGIQDMIFETNNGYKFPLYGIREGNTIKYVSDFEIQKLSSQTNNIEGLLNFP